MHGIDRGNLFFRGEENRLAKLESALLICHVRHSHTGRVLEKLERFGIRRIYVSVDGPRNEKDREMQFNLFAELDARSKNFPKFELRKSEENQGIGVAVISAVDWFFRNEQMGVVIEDDLDFDLDFLRYAEVALNVFETNREFWMISGSRLIPGDLEQEKVQRKSLVCNYPIIWGWASWADRWKEMLEGIVQFPNQEVKLSSQVKNFWKVGHKRVSKGIVDTWDIPLATSMRYLGKKCLMPPVNLVSNLGFDVFASNKMNSGFPLGIQIRNLPELHSQFFEEIKAQASTDSSEIQEVNHILERHVFGIKKRHSIIEWYSAVLDHFKIIGKVRTPLINRLLNQKQVSEIEILND